jgi:hypothetical protein
MKPPIISVNFYDSLRRGAFQFYRRLVPDRYDHTISAFGGYDSATITIACTRTEAEDWLETGLMRHVVAYASALDVIWEGFVDEVRVNMGPLTVTYGPLLNMANRVYVTYAPTVEGTYYSVYGSTDVLTRMDDTDSQDRFGIFATVVSGGSLNEANATYLQGKTLETRRWPKLTQSWNTGGSQAVTVTLNCKGYMHLLNYPYVTAVPYLDATSTIIDVLATSNPNVSWLAYDYANVEANAILAQTAAQQIPLALGAIQGAVAMGDTLNNRWLFYILSNLRAYYHAAPTDVEYRAYLEHGGLIVSTPQQGNVEPHRVLPGKWMAFDDFLAGRTVTEVASDPRMMFIERVTYRSPDGLQLAGGTTDDINQILAQFGMGGTAG